MDETQTPVPTPEQTPSTSPVKKSKGQKSVVLIILAVIVLLAIAAGGIVLLALSPEGTTAKVRDIFIIVVALESLILGVGLIVLILQLAALINLLQNEIKPILDSTNDTVNNLRGTTQFLSNNLVEPVMKLNEYLAGMKKFWDVFRPGKH